jgi:hypothetical protein
MQFLQVFKSANRSSPRGALRAQPCIVLSCPPRNLKFHEFSTEVAASSSGCYLENTQIAAIIV